MRVAETSGKTVDEAVGRALEQLGLRADQVDVDVIREGSKGFLGLGAEEAIVRVTAKESIIATGPPQRRDRGPRRDSGDEGRDDGGGRRRRGRRGGRGRRGDGDGPRGESADSQRRGGGRGHRDDERRRSGPITPVSPEEEVRIPGAPDELPAGPNTELEDHLDIAGSTLRDLLTLLGLTETEITARDPESPGDGEGLIAQVFDIFAESDDAAEDLGVLIGRRGETLANMQYLLNAIVSRRGEESPIYGIDIESYRRRREQHLVDMAMEIAAEVRATGDVITLEPMPPAERRIIHLCLAEEEGIRTESVGGGMRRQVEIMPA
jgi:spoIIIJ-associated protein